MQRTLHSSFNLAPGLLLLGCLAGPFATAGRASEPATFTNPIVESGADPWVIRRDGQYYLCQSRRGTGVWVGRSAQLHRLGQTVWARVWDPPKGAAYSREIWAPELHWLRDRWYVYVAADDGQNANHRMYVLEGDPRDPQLPFRFIGKIADPSDRWAIDGTVLTFDDGRLYFIWSGWEGTENVSQNLYLAPMSNPWTISGARVCISRPEYDWEKHGRPLINEGPQILRHQNRLFIIYSASGSWGDDYCLGQLAWTGSDPLKPESWVKKPIPVFSRTKDVFGPGHCSFVKSPDGREDWIVYHAAKRSGSGWDRNIRLQRFSWLPDGAPDFGAPVSPGVPLPLPSGSQTP
jgi:GH43 family beta-xylosidase